MKIFSDRNNRIYLFFALAPVSLSNLVLSPAEKRAFLPRTIWFVPFPACPQVERHKDPDNPVNPVG
jgi:hypothetical protein